MKQYAPLRVPLNKLLYFDSSSIDQFNGLTSTQIKSIQEDYSQDQIFTIGNAIISVCENKDLDFFELMPELRQRNYTQKQIETYLYKIKPVFLRFM